MLCVIVGAGTFNFYPPWNHQKTIGFLMISGVIEVTWFAQIRLILKAKFGDDPLVETLKG